MTNEKKHSHSGCNCAKEQGAGQRSNRSENTCKKCSFDYTKADYEGSENNQSENEKQRGQEYNNDLEETANKKSNSNDRNNHSR
ncbi:MAG: hypothetical protein P4L22_04040 [Candidatus Babeliales bacterium]|nr:hypothetical protein [Candidatus Babeliales bacterium]